jgi:hypothetical protein
MKNAKLGALVLAGGLAFAGCNDATSGQTIFRAQLASTNEVPARGTGANGAAGFALEGDTVRYSLEVHGIDNVVMAHIHSGAAGVNGPIRVFLFRGGPTSGVEGVLSEGAFTAADVTGVTFEQLLDEMRSGNAYVNVHTTEFPAGETRGQVQLVQ